MQGPLHTPWWAVGLRWWLRLPWGLLLSPSWGQAGAPLSLCVPFPSPLPSHCLCPCVAVAAVVAGAVAQVEAGLLAVAAPVAAAAGVGGVAEGPSPWWLVLGLGSSVSLRTVYLVIQMWGDQGKELLCWTDPSSSVLETLKLKRMDTEKSRQSGW